MVTMICKAIAAVSLGLFATGCAGKLEKTSPAPQAMQTAEAVFSYHSVGEITLGEPLAAAVDFQNGVFIADGVPGRIVWFDQEGQRSLEFQSPPRNPGFYPTDLELQGFFIYTVDRVNRTILRFDKQGAYRDILLNFNEEVGRGRVSPCGLDVDGSGRIAVTDIENHRILVYDVYLEIEIEFGSYGSFPGQFDTPEGISFIKGGGLLIADSGNRRINFFDEAGKFIRVVPENAQNNPLVRPRRAVMGEGGSIFVADPDAGGVFVFDQEGRLVRSFHPSNTDVFQPTDIELVGGDLLYVTDAATNSIYAFKVMDNQKP